MHGAIYGILGAIYGCCTLMWYHTWCHLWYHIWCGTCEIRKDAHVTTIYGTRYELELVKYGRTHISFPYMAPCMNWNLWCTEGRTCNFHIWHHVWIGTCEILNDAKVIPIHGTMYEMELVNYGRRRTSNFHIWHHVWSGTSAAFLPNGVHRQF